MQRSQTLCDWFVHLWKKCERFNAEFPIGYVEYFQIIYLSAASQQYPDFVQRYHPDDRIGQFPLEGIGRDAFSRHLEFQHQPETNHEKHTLKQNFNYHFETLEQAHTRERKGDTRTWWNPLNNNYSRAPIYIYMHCSDHVCSYNITAFAFSGRSFAKWKTKIKTGDSSPSVPVCQYRTLTEADRSQWHRGHRQRPHDDGQN